MPKARLKRGRRERTVAIDARARERVRCPRCQAEQDKRTACRACGTALVSDAVLDASGRELDVRALLAAPTREDALAMLVSKGVDTSDADAMLRAIERSTERLADEGAGSST